MNRIQPVNPVNHAYNIQANRNAKNQQNVANVNNTQQNRNVQSQQLLVRIRHQDEANNQATYNSQGQRQPVTDAVSTFEGVA